MNAIKIIIVILFVCCLSIGCNVQRERSYIRMSDRIVDRYLTDMKNQYDLNCFGSGGGFLEKVNRIIITFKIKGPKNKDELRTLMVNITEDLLNRYNQNEEIRPYLKNYPFTTENLRIGIILVGPNGIGIHNPGTSREHFYAIYQNRGWVEYVIENDEKIALQKVSEETYQEAFNIVKNQKSASED